MMRNNHGYWGKAGMAGLISDEHLFWALQRVASATFKKWLQTSPLAMAFTRKKAAGG